MRRLFADDDPRVRDVAPSPQARRPGKGQITVTKALIAINVLMYLVQMRYPSVTSAGWKVRRCEMTVEPLLPSMEGKQTLATVLPHVSFFRCTRS